MAMYDDWIAARPPQSEIDARRVKLRAELVLLDALSAIAHPTAEPSGGSDRDPLVLMPYIPDHSNGDDTPRPLTEERAAIVRAILNRPGRQASPAAVAHDLRQGGAPADDKLTQNTMARMVRAGQLVRVRKGRYAVTPQITALLRESELAGAA